MTRKGVYKNCIACGKLFYVPQYRKETAKFCSTYCQNHGQHDSIIKICDNCGIEFTVSSSRANKKFCSDLCATQAHITMKERRKKTKLLQRVKRGPTTSRTLRKFVFSNKPKRCEICGYSEFDFCLDVHHIDEDCTNNSIENLKVLCCICHKKYHKGVIDLNGNENK